MEIKKCTLDDVSQLAGLNKQLLPWNERGMKFWESCGFKEISRYMRFEK
ncbi:MAG: hypothetical protein IKB07_08015 [Lachnospiraceae bacterium]|nr:hypothetical protein [Lachnospiraceae bacterium]